MAPRISLVHASVATSTPRLWHVRPDDQALLPFRQIGRHGLNRCHVSITGALALPVLLLFALWFMASGHRVLADDREAGGERLPREALARLGTLRLKHQDDINSVIFSKDGKTIISGGNDNAIRFWDASTGREVARPVVTRSGITSLAVSPGGETILSGDWAGHTVLWQLSTMVPLLTRAQNGSVNAVAFSPDGTQFACGGDDRTVRCWDTKTGRLIRVLLHDQPLTGIAYSPDGMKIATSSYDQFVRIWNLGDENNEIRLANRNADFMFCVAFSADGATLAVGGDDSAPVSLWNVRDGRNIGRLQCDDDVSAIAYSCDGKQLAAGVKSGEVLLWDINESRLVRKFQYSGRITSICMPRDERKVVACGGDDRIIRVFDIGSGRELLRSSDHTRAVLATAFSPDNRFLVSGGLDSTALMWDLATRKVVRRLDHGNNSILCLAYSPDGKSVASGGDDSTILIWDVATGEVLHRFQHGDGPVSCLVYSPDGRSVASGGSDSTVQIWDLATARPVHRLRNGDKGVSCVTFSPDSRNVVSGGPNSVVLISDLLGDKALREVISDNHIIYLNVFSERPAKLAMCKSDGSCELVDFETIKRIAVSPKPEVRLVSCASLFRSESRYIFVYNNVADSTLNVARVFGTAGPALVLAAHKAPIQALAFSNDGKYVASGSYDTTVILWEVNRMIERLGR